MNMTEYLHSTSARPFRHVTKVVVLTDPETGQEKIVATGSTDAAITEDGATTIYETEHATCWDCFHPLTRPFGGRCYDTGQLVCETCLITCCCGKPIAREVAFTWQDNGQPLLLCEECYVLAKRRRLCGVVARALLSPFVEFGVEDRS